MKQHLDRIKEAIVSRKLEWLMVICLFMLAFAVRAYLFKYELFFEFDGYWHARVISYIIQTGTFPAVDPMAYYQLAAGGSYLTNNGSEFFWNLSAFLYHVFTLGAAYNKEAWFFFVKLFPALFGSLAAITLYFIGKDVFNDKKAGALMAFFAAVMPAFAYRQMAGWLEDDSFGWFPFLLGILFLVRSLKSTDLKSGLINGALAGVFFTVMAFSWPAYPIIPLIMMVFVALALVYHFLLPVIRVDLKEGPVPLKSMVAGLAVAFLIFSGVTIAFQETVWLETTTTAILKYSPISKNNIDNITQASTSQVGEESKGANYFTNKYNLFIPYIFVPLAFILAAFALFRKERHYSILLLLAIVTITFVMGFTKLKWTYYLGLGMSITVAIVIYEAWKLSHQWSNFSKRLAFLAMGFLVLTGAAAGMFFVTQNVPNIEYGDGWKESLTWIRTNTPTDSKFFNWWDEGHWISFIGERRVTLDNRGYDYNAIKQVAEFFSTSNEQAAIDRITLEPYNSDYLIMDTGVIQSIPSYAAYLAEDGITPEIQSYAAARASIIGCQLQTAINGQQTYQCGDATVAAEEYEKFPTTWQSQPTDVSGRDAIFIYRSSDTAGNARIYVLNPQANESMAAKIWFGKESVASHFTEVYFFKNVKVFQVK